MKGLSNTWSVRILRLSHGWRERTIRRYVIGRIKVVPLLSESPVGNQMSKNDKRSLLKDTLIKICKYRSVPECVRYLINAHKGLDTV